MWRRSGAWRFVYFIWVTLPVTDCLSLLIAYPSDNETATQAAPGFLAQAIAIANAAQQLNVTTRPISCDGVDERAVAAAWATAHPQGAAMIGGCCSGGWECQNVLPQITFGSRRGSPSSFYMYPSLETADQAIAAFASSMQWEKLLVITADDVHYEQQRQGLMWNLGKHNIFVQLKTFGEDVASLLSKEKSYDAVVWHANCGLLQRHWRQVALSGSQLLLPLSVTSSDFAKCLPADFEGLVFAEGFVGQAAIAAAQCGLSASASSITNDSALQRCMVTDAAAAMLEAWANSGYNAINLRESIAQLSVYGLTGKIAFTSSNNRKYDVSVRRYVNGSVVATVTYTSNSSSSIVADLTRAGRSSGDFSALECSEAAKAVAGLLGVLILLGIGYAVAMLAFNWIKRKDRMIKLTSPNLNIITCAGCIGAYMSLIPLGLGEPVVRDLVLMAKLKQGGAFTLSTAVTVMLGSVLLKTWRIYRIFSKPQSKGTVTRDEHLLLMLLGFLIIDVILHVVWITTDPYECTWVTYNYVTNHSLTLNSSSSVSCSPRNAAAWYATMYLYKCTLLSATAYCAFRIRHVSHPSLNDSGSIFANVWTIAVVAFTTMPLVLRGSDQCQIGTYAALGLAAFLVTTSSLTWLFMPKIMLMKWSSEHNKSIKFKHVVKLRRASPQKSKDDSNNSNRASTKTSSGKKFWQKSTKRDKECCTTMVRQEMECLKQKLKEKDDAIRELTDRLFFGTGSLHSYVERKLAPKSSATTAIPESDSCSRGSTAASSEDLHGGSAGGGLFITDVQMAYPRHCSDLDRPLEGTARYRFSRSIDLGCAPRDGHRKVNSTFLDDPAKRDSPRARTTVTRNAAEFRTGHAGRPEGENAIAALLPTASGAPDRSSLATDEEPDSGVYTASCSEKGFTHWPKSNDLLSDLYPSVFFPSHKVHRMPLSTLTLSKCIIETSREDMATEV